MKRLRGRPEAASYPECLRDNFRRWSTLRAWGPRARVFERTALNLRRRRKDPAHPYASGHAWWHGPRIVVTAGADYADALGCLLHEMAHIVAPVDEAHGSRFWALLAEAVEEVTGLRVVYPPGAPKWQKQCAVTAAIQVWISTSGVSVPETVTARDRERAAKKAAKRDEVVFGDEEEV